jgi:hypothetical protein
MIDANLHRDLWAKLFSDITFLLIKNASFLGFNCLNFQTNNEIK